MTDISFPLGGHQIKLRVGAVIRRHDEVLLCHNPKHEIWYTPGGRIKAGEDSRTALIRELQEELGAGFLPGRQILVGENIFEFLGNRCHEICFYYDVADSGCPSPSETCDGEELHWISIRHLAALDLKPPFLKDHLLHPRPELQWVIHRD